MEKSKVVVVKDYMTRTASAVEGEILTLVSLLKNALTQQDEWLVRNSDNIEFLIPLEYIERKKDMVSSTSDERTVNNVMRHQYKVLSDEEKQQMQKVKDIGLDFFNYVGELGDSRELSLAKTKIEEAVMWAVKHITG